MFNQSLLNIVYKKLKGKKGAEAEPVPELEPIEQGIENSK